MKLHVLLLAFLIISGIQIKAQKNYQKGYIINRIGDTVQGWIDYRNWDLNPEFILFKTSLESPSQRLGLNELDYFEITGVDYYKKFILWKDIDPVAISAVDANDMHNRSFAKDTAFLRMIVKGEKVSLYLLQDFKQHFFIKPEKDTLAELIYRVYYTNYDLGQVKTEYTFRNQLKQYTFNDYVSPSVRKKIDIALYRENYLRSIVTGLNPGGNNLAGSRSRAGNMVDFFAGGGISYGKIRFTGINESFNSLKFNPTAGYFVFTGVDLFSPRRRQNLFVRIEAGYRSSYQHGKSDTREYEMRINSVTLGASVNYTILKRGDTKLFTGIGMEFNFSSYPKDIFTTYDQNGDVVSERKNYFKLEKTWIGIPARIGCKINKRMEAGAIFKIGGKYLTFVHFDMRDSRFYPYVSYLF